MRDWLLKTSTIMFWKNNDLIAKLETGSDSDNDKRNKHHKYTLDEALQAVSKFRDESDFSDLSD